MLHKLILSVLVSALTTTFTIFAEQENHMNVLHKNQTEKHANAQHKKIKDEALQTESNVIIKPIEQLHIQDARTIIYNAVFELQILPSQSVDAVIQEIIQANSLPDINDITSIEKTYTSKKGTFLVVIKDGIVAGMGAIKNLDDQTCELTRMFFAPKYRGQGLGSQLIEQLLLSARQFGYRKIQLNVWNPTTQTKAINFYKKFCFSEIDPYKDSTGKVFMEKTLEEKN